MEGGERERERAKANAITRVLSNWIKFKQYNRLGLKSAPHIVCNEFTFMLVAVCFLFLVNLLKFNLNDWFDCWCLSDEHAIASNVRSNSVRCDVKPPLPLSHRTTNSMQMSSIQLGRCHSLSFTSIVHRWYNAFASEFEFQNKPTSNNSKKTHATIYGQTYWMYLLFSAKRIELATGERRINWITQPQPNWKNNSNRSSNSSSNSFTQKYSEIHFNGSTIWRLHFDPLWSN